MPLAFKSEYKLNDAYAPLALSKTVSQRLNISPRTKETARTIAKTNATTEEVRKLPNVQIIAPYQAATPTRKVNAIAIDNF